MVKMMVQFKYFAILSLFCLDNTLFITKGSCQTDTPRVLKSIYVIAREGTSIKKTPYSYAEDISGAPYGAMLLVTKVYKYWYAVKINTPDKIGYIKKTVATSDETKIPLTNDDLAEIYEDNSQNLNPHVNIELRLITKQQFYAAKKTSVNYFLADTNKIRSKKGIIKLPLKKGFKILHDKPDYNKIDSNTYGYAGQYPTLNKYVVENCDGEAEDCGYIFIDKTTGKTTEVSEDFPYLSKNKSMIMSLHANDYENNAILHVLKINKSSITLYAAGEYKNWMPAQTTEQFWGSDNCFYVPVIPSIAHFGDKRAAGYNYRYVKIKFKKPTSIPNKDTALVNP